LIALIDNMVMSELVRAERAADRATVEHAVERGVLWCPAMLPLVEEAMARPVHRPIGVRNVREALGLMKRLSRGAVLRDWEDRLRAESAGCSPDAAATLRTARECAVLWRDPVALALDGRVRAAIGTARRDAERRAAELQVIDEGLRRDPAVPRLRECNFEGELRQMQAGSDTMVEIAGDIVRKNGWDTWAWKVRPHACPSLSNYILYYFVRMIPRAIDANRPTQERGSYRIDIELFCAAAYVDVVVTHDTELAGFLNQVQPCRHGAWSLDQIVEWARSATA
jgi:hypothetical protein